ncbi:MAG: hypothetical protein EA398_14490 [Deltaproteobacteria bacterium]|nr:MAG: hypothetical protein EA398_14490 [Deltaproteobacteria bacterium]
MDRLADRFRRAATGGLNALQDRIVAFDRSGGFEGVARRIRDGIRDGESRLAASDTPWARQAQVRQWYRRLELEPGADADAVRRAYRGLMRKYHPDRFTSDPEAERQATALSQELTVAYTGLLRHLGEK